MKVSRAQAEENRERILDNAAQLFRERGFDGIGLNDLMQAAGLTRGGFYGHFESKDDLAAQATQRALQSNREQWKQQTDRSLSAWIKAYLSDAHRDRLGAGCGLAALAGDAARGGPAVQQAFGEGVECLATTLQTQMSAADAVGRREQALALLSTLVGALLLSRAVGDAGLSRELREAARKYLPVDMS
ncbi:TetR/AcrR family transcriptional regulator [Roseateles sp.]|uniref:TetR/AcrR family transcriptional regulator n=1 Tax=Roseateles sp. TaxID=1971397 RepID=UPI0025ECA353|nr:TetR/AcrR family transcriptional regulator [Roseateles sp.]MBV8034074.1 TetR/AcrR family transcriptional regulator [Roseateles sp.]